MQKMQEIADRIYASTGDLTKSKSITIISNKLG